MLDFLHYNKWRRSMSVGCGRIMAGQPTPVLATILRRSGSAVVVTLPEAGLDTDPNRPVIGTATFRSLNFRLA